MGIERSPSIMQDVQARMEQVYGKSDNRGRCILPCIRIWLIRTQTTRMSALERLQVRGTAKRKLQELDESLGSRGDIFHFAHTRRGGL